MVDTVEDIYAFDATVLAMVKIPSYYLVFVSIWLYSSVSSKTSTPSSLSCLRIVGLTAYHNSGEPPVICRNRLVIWSWLSSPSSNSDSPVAVTLPKLLIR